MAVYMDKPRTVRWRGRNVQSAHVMADSTEELLAFCDRISAPHWWVQKLGQRGEHLDVLGRQRCAQARELVDEVLSGQDLVRRVLWVRWGRRR